VKTEAANQIIGAILSNARTKDDLVTFLNQYIDKDIS
jgi:hypothetical protein